MGAVAADVNGFHFEPGLCCNKLTGVGTGTGTSGGATVVFSGRSGGKTSVNLRIGFVSGLATTRCSGKRSSVAEGGVGASPAAWGCG